MRARLKQIWAAVLALALAISPAFAGSSTYQVPPNSSGPLYQVGTNAAGNFFGVFGICDGAACANIASVTSAGLSGSNGLGVQGVTGGVPVNVAGAFWQTVQPVSFSPPGPYQFTPKSPGQHNVTISSSTGLIVPSGATCAWVQVFGGTGRYTTDGTTTPTVNLGMTLLQNGQPPLFLSGATMLTNFRIISSSGTLDVEYCS